MVGVVDYLQAAAVVSLYASANDLPNGYNNRSSTEDFLAHRMNLEQVHPAFDELIPSLVRDGILEVIQDEMAGEFYKFNRQRVIEFYGSYKEDPSTLGGRMALVGLQLLQHALRNFKDEEYPVVRPMLSGAPAANRIVTFEHNSQPFSDLVEATEQAEEIIRGSNSVNEESKGWIRAHIQAGIEFVKSNRKMLAGAAAFLLLEPLKTAYETVAEEPAKAAILAAINAVRAFFGL